VGPGVRLCNEQVYRIGGGAASNLVLKPAEAKLDPPGISVLIGGTPQQAAADFRRVFGPKSRLGRLAGMVGESDAAAIQSVGFEVMSFPTSNFPNHGRLIHPTLAAAGFDPDNLDTLSAVFIDHTGL
jgi:hypothetical protein